MAGPEGLAAVFAGLVGLALLMVALKRWRSATSWLGLAHALASIGVAWWVVHSWRADSEAGETGVPVPATSASAASRAGGAFLLRPDAKPLAASVHELGNDGLDLSTLATAAARERRLLLLDGSHGIAPRHADAIARAFGKPVAPTSPRQRVCATGSSLMPLATTACAARPTPFALPAAAEPLAMTADGQATAALARLGDATAVLLLHGPADAPTPEDECLMTLARGGVCTLLSALPAHAQRALALEPGAFAEAADRFGVPLTFEPLGDTDCGALRQSAVDVTRGLETARNERDVIAAREALALRSRIMPLTTLALGTPSSADAQLRHVRSFLTALKEAPYWLTRCDEFRSRLATVSQATFAADGSRVALRTAAPLAAAAIAVISVDAPARVAVRTAPVTTEPASGFELSRQGPYLHRLIIENLAHEARLDLGAWLSPPPEKLRLPEIDRSARLALPLALALGALASLLQAVAARGIAPSAYFPGTSVPVTALVFIWIWYSVSAASRGDAARGAYVESAAPAEATTLVFDDWPEPSIAAQSTSGESAALPVDDAWTKLVAAAEASIPAQPAGQMTIVLASGRAVVEGGGAAKILLLEDAGSRNWYFRKTTAFAAARAGWLAFTGTAAPPEGIEEADFAASPPALETVVVALDPRFLSAETWTALAQWVKDGGRLIVGERWGGTTEAPMAASALADTLRSVGIGSSKEANYARVNAEEGTTFEVTTAHRVVPDRGVVSGVAHGKGAVVFLGTHPGAGGGSDALVRRVLAGMTGAQLHGAGSSAGACKSLVLLQPFGVAGAAFGDVLAALEEARVPAALALDGPSLASMCGTLPAAARTRVVLADDGAWRSRYLGKALIDGLRGTEAPLVASMPGRRPADRGGPGGTLVASVWLGAKLPTAELDTWKRECRQGHARPRVLLAGAFAPRDAVVNALRSLNMDPSATLAHVAAAMAPSRAKGGKPRRALPHDPLNFED